MVAEMEKPRLVLPIQYSEMGLVIRQMDLADLMWDECVLGLTRVWQWKQWQLAVNQEG